MCTERQTLERLKEDASKMHDAIARAKAAEYTLLRARIALQAAWPYVHSHCTINSVRNEVALLMNSKDMGS